MTYIVHNYLLLQSSKAKVYHYLTWPVHPSSSFLMDLNVDYLIQHLSQKRYVNAGVRHNTTINKNEGHSCPEVSILHGRVF